MLTAKQIINLARKQEWWNEFDEKRHLSVEDLALHALNTGRYASFLIGSFLIDSLVWYDRAEQFAKLCKEEEEKVKSKVPEYDLVVSDKVVARFYTHGNNLTNDERSQIYALLKADNISYDTMDYNTGEKVLIVYKHSSSWVRR